MNFIAPKASLRRLQRIPHDVESREGFELMDRNERTVDFPPEVMAQLRERLTPFLLRAYPEPEPLYARLAAWLLLSRDMLLLTAGADGGLKAIFDVFVEPGDEVVSVAPSYGMYPVYAAMAGAVLREVRFSRQLALPLEGILERITARTKLVVLANPNQPIERVYSPEEIQTLLEACAAHDTLLVLDEAYHQFCPVSAIPRLKDCGHLIVVRTFSKAFGIAGIRLGYVVSQPRTITALNAVRATHEAHGVAIAVGLYLLEHEELMHAYVAQVKETIAFLAPALRRLGLEASGRWSNAILVTLPPELPSPEVAQALKERGFLVRSETDPPLTNHLRITVGPRAQAERFLAALEQVLPQRMPA